MIMSHDLGRLAQDEISVEKSLVAAMLDFLILPKLFE